MNRNCPYKVKNVRTFGVKNRRFTLYHKFCLVFVDFEDFP